MDDTNSYLASPCGVHSSCYCCILDTMTTALMMPYHILYYPMCNMVNEETSAAVAVVSTGVTCDVIWLAAQFLFLK